MNSFFREVKNNQTAVSCDHKFIACKKTLPDEYLFIFVLEVLFLKF